MTDLAAIKALWATYKPVPTRNTLQLILEVPLEQQEEVFRRLGFPVSGKETWVGVALLRMDAKQEEKPKIKPGWQNMSYGQRSGILRNDERFLRWLRVDEPETAAEYIRRSCGVQSCAAIDGDPDARKSFDLMYSQYMAATGQMAEQR